MNGNLHFESKNLERVASTLDYQVRKYKDAQSNDVKIWRLYCQPDFTWNRLWRMSTLVKICKFDQEIYASRSFNHFCHLIVVSCILSVKLIQFSEIRGNKFLWMNNVYVNCRILISLLSFRKNYVKLMHSFTVSCFHEIFLHLTPPIFLAPVMVFSYASEHAFVK